MMETLRYADEVKKAEQRVQGRAGREAAKPIMIELAEELIERKAKKFDAASFKDSYEEALRELIDAKARASAGPRRSRKPPQGAKSST